MFERKPWMLHLHGSLLPAHVTLGILVFLATTAFREKSFGVLIVLAALATIVTVVLISTALHDQWQATGFPRCMYRLQRMQPPTAEEPDDTPEA